MSGQRVLGCGCLMSLLLTGSSYAQYMATSDDFTLIFGVEADQPNSLRLDEQHVDIYLNYFGGAGDIHVVADDLSDPDNPVIGAPIALDAAHLYSNPNDQQTMGQPSIDAGFGFIGADVGETFWFISAFSGGDSIFLGVSSVSDINDQLVAWNPGDAAKGANFSAKWQRLELVSVNAPSGGQFAMFDINSPAPPTVYMATSDGIDQNDVYYIPDGGHDHVNWTFTQPGIYEVTVRVTTMVPVNYGSWLWHNGLADTTGFTETANGGLSYGALYALGLDPAAPDLSARPYLTLVDGKPAFYFDLPDLARSDLTYEIWKTNDLMGGNWSQLDAKVGAAAWSGVTETVSSVNGRTLYRYVEAAAPGNGARDVYQLRISR